MDFSKASLLIIDKLERWARAAIVLLPNLILAVVILFAGIWLSKHIAKLIGKLAGRFLKNNLIAGLIVSFVQILVIAVTIFVALSILQLSKAVTSLLAGAGIIALALGFAFQDLASNFISGILMSFTRPMRIGDTIRTKDFEGTVLDIRLREITLRTFQGQNVIIPNKDVIQNALTNFSQSGKRRLDLEIGVAYESDLDLVEKVTKEAAEKVDGRTDDPVALYYNNFADSAINFTLQIWLDLNVPPGFLAARSQAIKLITQAYRKNNIDIPFPITSINIPSGERLLLKANQTDKESQAAKPQN